MKHLFIDTNILLSFLHFTSDDLEEIRKLSALIKSGEITLLLPEQVRDEFRRNREVKLADSLRRLKQQTLSLQFPQVCKVYPQYNSLRRAQEEYGRQHAELLSQLEKDIAAGSLEADEVISELFGLAAPLPRTEAIIAAARVRREVGNPPGKSGSAGDAINWETVLANPPSDDLYFVTGDSDYSSPVDSTRFNDFLLAEWTTATSKSLHYYTQLSRFFKENFPTIQLADEVEKDRLAQELLASGSFAETHSIVGRLAHYSEFTPTQAALIAEAATTNDQVGSIAGDSDVTALLKRIVTRYPTHLDRKSLKILREFLGISDPE